jgi:hypothetical protein
MVVANLAAAIACACDFDSDPMLAPRTLLGGASGAPLNSAHGAWEFPVKFGAQRLKTYWRSH